jgi:hypothetical protein
MPKLQLPSYQCHKIVQAATIVEIHPAGSRRDGDPLGQRAMLVLKIGVTEEWLEKHEPQIGGWYVLYPDGYASYSPAKAFEDGYAPVSNEAGAGSTQLKQRHFYIFARHDRGVLLRGSDGTFWQWSGGDSIIPVLFGGAKS